MSGLRGYEMDIYILFHVNNKFKTLLLLVVYNMNCELIILNFFFFLVQREDICFRFLYQDIEIKDKRKFFLLRTSGIDNNVLIIFDQTVCFVFNNGV